jgi:HAD superfamily hydrolase (TIGR01509 family)
MIKAVLFDMDGVLVDSEEYICKAAMAMFEEKGLKVEPEDFLPFVGAGEDRYIGGVAQKYDFPLDLPKAKERTYEIYGEMVSGNIEPLPGVKEFIDRCREKGLKLAVATSADKVKMLTNLREIGIPAETFDQTLNGQDVEHKKPAPDIYLIAAGKLGVDPKSCLVVEDAQNGVEAAKAAGCKCLGLTTSFSAEQLRSKGADWIAADLSGAPDEVINW